MFIERIERLIKMLIDSGVNLLQSLGDSACAEHFFVAIRNISINLGTLISYIDES